MSPSAQRTMSPRDSTGSDIRVYLALTLLDIQCAWFNEACYNEFVPRLLLPSRSARRIRAEDLQSVCRTNRTVDPVHFIPAKTPVRLRRGCAPAALHARF